MADDHVTWGDKLADAKRASEKFQYWCEPNNHAKPSRDPVEIVHADALALCCNLHSLAVSAHLNRSKSPAGLLGEFDILAGIGDGDSYCQGHVNFRTGRLASNPGDLFIAACPSPVTLCGIITESWHHATFLLVREVQRTTDGTICSGFQFADNSRYPALEAIRELGQEAVSMIWEPLRFLDPDEIALAEAHIRREMAAVRSRQVDKPPTPASTSLLEPPATVQPTANGHKSNNTTPKGRPLKWLDLWKIIKKADKRTPKPSDQEIATEYNRKYGSTIGDGPGGHEKATAKTVRSIRHAYGRRFGNEDCK